MSAIPNQQNASFEGFLKGVKRYKRDTVTASQGRGRVLKALQDGPLPADEIRKRTELGLADFARLIEQLREEGLIDVAGAPGTEVFSLTAQGHRALATLR